MKHLVNRKRLSITWWIGEWEWGFMTGACWVLDLGPLCIVWDRRPRTA